MKCKDTIKTFAYTPDWLFQWSMKPRSLKQVIDSAAAKFPVNTHIEFVHIPPINDINDPCAAYGHIGWRYSPDRQIGEYLPPIDLGDPVSILRHMWFNHQVKSDNARPRRLRS